MILAADLDRTLLPNGEDEYDGTIPLFFDLLKKTDFTLVYVSGRNLNLLGEAVEEYGIEFPDYFIGETGTVLYEKENSSMKPSGDWIGRTNDKNPNWSRDNIVPKIGKEDVLELQEGWKQNDHKVSYYLKNQRLKDGILKHIHRVLEENKINARVIWSVDPLQNVGLIDILPKTVTKLGALEFLREKLGESKKEVIYCGDSGNDILPLTFGYISIVVKNAPEDVKKEVIKTAKNKNLENNIYVAMGTDKLNGNYSSGIIEGLAHFGFIKKI